MSILSLCSIFRYFGTGSFCGQTLGPLPLGLTQPVVVRQQGSRRHAGPGFVQRNIRSGNQVQQVQEKEVRFIFDQDVYSTGKVKVAAVAETLNALHAHSDSVFSDAITTVLHDAMEPEYL